MTFTAHFGVEHDNKTNASYYIIQLQLQPFTSFHTFIRWQTMSENIATVSTFQVVSNGINFVKMEWKFSSKKKMQENQNNKLDQFVWIPTDSQRACGAVHV